VIKRQWSVGQSTISANPGLNLTHCFDSYISGAMSAHFKILENETSDDPDKISEKIFPSL
jgi:hypothetical protein